MKKGVIMAVLISLICAASICNAAPQKFKPMPSKDNHKGHHNVQEGIHFNPRTDSMAAKMRQKERRDRRWAREVDHIQSALEAADARRAEREQARLNEEKPISELTSQQLREFYKNDANYNEALNLCNKLIADNPKDPRGYFAKWTLYSMRDNNKLAREAADNIITKCDRYQLGCALKITSYLKMGHDIAAIRCCDEYAVKIPTSHLPYVYKGGIYTSLRSYQDALNMYDKALSLIDQDKDVKKPEESRQKILELKKKVIEASKQ